MNNKICENLMICTWIIVEIWTNIALNINRHILKLLSLLISQIHQLINNPYAITPQHLVMIDKSIVEISTKEKFAKISRWNCVTLRETNGQI